MRTLSIIILIFISNILLAQEVKSDEFEHVVLRNKNNIIPIKKLDTLNMALISFSNNNFFEKSLKRYASITKLDLPKAKIKNWWAKQPYNLIMLEIDNISDENIKIVNEVIKCDIDIIAYISGSVDSFDISGIQNITGLISSETSSNNSKDLCSQIIFGGIASKGVLKDDKGKYFKKGDGIFTQGNIRFSYLSPDKFGLDTTFMNNKIDSIAQLGISAKAFPGCRVFAVKDKNVIFDKCYGYHTYDSLTLVNKTDLYDFASVTKITGALPAIMKLHSENKIDLDTTFSTYWEPFKKTNKKDIIVRNALAHQGRLIPWIPYWKKCVKRNGNYKKRFIRPVYSEKFPIAINENLYLNKDFKNKIYRAIKRSDLLEEEKYKYSGLIFYLFPEIIENLSGEKYVDYLNKHIYKPLGANTLCFNPYKKIPLNKIVPTEVDTFFRKQLIKGYVHDSGAALMGGESGNAGLFGTAEDIAKVMQMYLSYGIYGGERYINEETLIEFTKIQFEKNENRRGLGFDKPLLEDKENGTPAVDASKKSFGHSGYTGTFVWADPENGLLYVFLSNRVYPSRNNRQIYDLNIRHSIHQVFYDAIKKAED